MHSTSLGWTTLGGILPAQIINTISFNPISFIAGFIVIVLDNNFLLDMFKLSLKYSPSETRNVFVERSHVYISNGATVILSWSECVALRYAPLNVTKVPGNT